VTVFPATLTPATAGFTVSVIVPTMSGSVTTTWQVSVDPKRTNLPVQEETPKTGAKLGMTTVMGKVKGFLI